ncbi:MAG: GAF domain-containing protein [Chloroflexi bacterium]|nr:GAF domain-containing protein [Chloroflexota bacterium]
MNMMSNNNPPRQVGPENTTSGEYMRNWRQSFIRPMLVLGLAFGLIGMITGILGAQNLVTTLVLVTGYLLALATALLPFPYFARVLVLLAGLFGVAVNELVLYGILGDAGLYFYAVIVIATLMLSTRAGWYALSLSLLVIAAAGAAFLSGLVDASSAQIGYADLMDWLSNLAMLIVFSVIIILGLQQLQKVIGIGETETRTALNELEENHRLLEDRIQLRTTDLEQARHTSERRARQFEAIAQVARVIASVQDMDLLLPRITQVISQQFGFYHIGIFFLDEAREYAVFKAANTEGGQRMLARGHRLKIGQTGIVGYVAGAGSPRIALNAGEDAVFFNNPDLPKTRSEMALPLRVGRDLIGVLDVQSEEVNAFKPEDVEALSTLADQVAIAIQNARSFREAQNLLAEAQKNTSTYITEAWKVLRSETTIPGYRTSGSLVKQLDVPLEGEHIQRALHSSDTVLQARNLTVPILLRGEAIGVIDLLAPPARSWSADEVDIAKAVAERLSLAIETSTLLSATQHRADVERLTAEISTRLSASNRMEAIIQATAEELSRALGGSDVTVQIQPVALDAAEVTGAQGEAQ